MRLRLVVVLALAAIGAAGPGRAARGDITLLGQILPAGADHITDVWGYVDPGGREYAIVGDWNLGVHIVDVTDPGNPVVRKQILSAGPRGFDVKVWGHYIYTCNGSGRGSASRVVDISDLDNPVVSAAFTSAHNFSVSDDGYLYASLFGLKAYRIQGNPMYPAFLWSDGSGDAHDSAPVADRLYDFRGAFFARIYDISNREAPVLLGTIQDPDMDYYHSGYPSEDGGYLFICDELADHPTADIVVFDISDPAAAVRVAGVADPDATVHNLYVVGDLAFTSYYAAGFRVYDIADPTMPVLLDEYDTSAFDTEGYEGCFGVYPFAPSGYVYVTDQDNGLYVFAVDDETATPVAITAFDARPASGGGVALEWAVFHDESFQGFRVTRDGDEGARVIAAALPAHARRLFDDSTEPGRRYTWTVTALGDGGAALASLTAAAHTPAVRTRLFQNHPNPFNPSTTISWQVERAGHIRLTIHDARGRQVRTLADGPAPAGAGATRWDGRDDRGRALPSGVYFYRLETPDGTQARHMLLLK